MLTLRDEFATLETGIGTQHRNLTLYPLLRKDPPVEPAPDYLLLDEALKQGLARITEVGDTGSVNELHFENSAERPILLVDGEALVGAKQNRVLNLTVLVPAHTAVRIPVSCVEAGRWRRQTREFSSSSNQMFYSRGRAAKAEQVTRYMRSSPGTRLADQSAVWGELRSKMHRMKSPSRTEAMSDVFDSYSKALDDYEKAFRWTERQTGVACLIHGRPLGFDLFDHPVTMRVLFPKLLRSYALDALDTEATPAAAGDSPGAISLLEAAARAEAFKERAVGLGEDVRFTGDQVRGAALWTGQRYVHVCGFARETVKC